ncbi:50S ribosomal protein L19 [Candidatus Peregrinibacteria bacterium]|nr:50S ribosomal protein L19 [Candidatus Peregrinibacteria bacterium]
MSLLQDVQKLAIKKKIPDLKPGYTVRIHQKIKEGEKERVQIFEGLIIKISSGHGADKTFTVRKIVEGIGVEKIFPPYSPNIEKIQVKKEGKVRRAKLYYMTNRFGKSARLQETFVGEEELEHSIEELAAQKAKEEAEKAKEEGTPAQA